MKMKKIYISPEIEVLEISLGAIMVTKSPITDDGDRAHDVDGTASEFRNDWDNIWENM